MNKILILTLSAFLASCASNPAPSSDKPLGYKGTSQKNVFGYSSPKDALSDLKNKKDHTTREVEGDHGKWQIIKNNVNSSIWSFTPQKHPAHPSVIRRKVIEKEGSIFILTEVRCGSSKTVCDSLVKDFLKLDDKIRDSMSKV
ncbi:MAG: molecular chaperone DnaJ [Colwellia sp.]|nr:molecular chaperone DnaJ [Colwellia sp.]